MQKSPVLSSVDPMPACVEARSEGGARRAEPAGRRGRSRAGGGAPRRAARRPATARPLQGPKAAARVFPPSLTPAHDADPDPVLPGEVAARLQEGGAVVAPVVGLKLVHNQCLH